MDESAANRALFATSPDGEHWSEPAVLFNTTAGTHHNLSSKYPSGYNIGIEVICINLSIPLHPANCCQTIQTAPKNEGWILAPDESGRMYGMASSWDVFQRYANKHMKLHS
jgi:hypothetical protein